MKLAVPLLASLVVSWGAFKEDEFVEEFINGTLADLANNCTRIIKSSAFNRKIEKRFTSKELIENTNLLQRKVENNFSILSSSTKNGKF